MRSKRIIGIAVIVITGLVILGLYIAYEWKQTIEIYRYGRNNYEKERTNEEYMAILTDNQEDFEYVALTMQQWSRGSIHFEDDYGRRIDFENVSSNNPEIEDEISNNDDFYKSLKNLYELDEIDYIMIEREEIMFYFSKFREIIMVVLLMVKI